MEDMRAVEAIVDVRSGSAWASDQVPSHGYEEYLWSDGAFVCIGTTRRFGATSVRIEVLSAAPTAEPPDDWQHVAEASLDEGATWRCTAGMTAHQHRPFPSIARPSDEEPLFQVWPRSQRRRR